MKEIINHEKELHVLTEFAKWATNGVFKEDELLPFILTLKEQKATYGYCSCEPRYKTVAVGDAIQKEIDYLEISYNIDELTRPFMEIFVTIIHELIHNYCRKQNINETSNNHRYHNQAFKKLCDKYGLETSKVKTYGFSTTGKMSKELEDNIVKNFIDVFGRDKIEEAFKIDRINRGAKQGKKSTNLVKYVCPVCGQIARAKNDANLVCGECDEVMEAQ